jgi:hypothetical protein
LVSGVPFSPLDIDIGHLTRGEWNPATDRFRVWVLPREGSEKPVCYVMVRKFDPRDMVLVYMHMVVNLEYGSGKSNSRSFTIGILSNDDVRARAALNGMLEIPPSFHRRREVRLVERRWRKDPDANMRFAANVHSAIGMTSARGAVYGLKFGAAPGLLADMKRGLGIWWTKEQD